MWGIPSLSVFAVRAGTGFPARASAGWCWAAFHVLIHHTAVLQTVSTRTTHITCRTNTKHYTSTHDKHTHSLARKIRDNWPNWQMWANSCCWQWRNVDDPSWVLRSHWLHWWWWFFFFFCLTRNYALHRFHTIPHLISSFHSCNWFCALEMAKALGLIPNKTHSLYLREILYFI